MEQNNIIPDVEMIPTCTLIDELLKRCAPAIFIGTKYDIDGINSTFRNFQNWRGNLETCRGLCHEMDCVLQREMIRQENGDAECD